MWHFLLVFLTPLPSIFAINPGIKTILTNKGLQYGCRVGTVLLQKKLSSIPIPTVEGDIHIGFLGSVHFWLKSMEVVQTDLPDPIVNFCNGTGVKVGMDGLSISVHGTWQTQYSFIHDGGTFDLALFNVGLSTLLQLNSDDQGHLGLASLDCSSYIDRIDINFYGGASFFFKPFVEHFKQHIKDDIQQKICPMISQFVADLDSELAKMGVSFQINDNLVIDIPLLVSPIIRSSDVEMDVKGVFYSTRQHEEPPFAAQPFELTEQPEFYLNLGLSEFTVNTVLYAYDSAGLLQINITDAMIPKDVPFRLNTTSLGYFIPQLPKMFPNMLVLLQMYTSESPTVSFHTDEVILNISACTKAYGIQPNSTLTPLFRLDSDTIFSSNIFISEEKLRGTMELKNFTLSLGSSEIGTFQVSTLQNMLKLGIQKWLVPQINQKLKQGIPLPDKPNIHWVNTILKVNQGFVAVVTDAEM